MPGTPWEWGAGQATLGGSGKEAGSPQTLKVLRAEKGIGCFLFLQRAILFLSPRVTLVSGRCCPVEELTSGQ